MTEHDPDKQDPDDPFGDGLSEPVDQTGAADGYDLAQDPYADDLASVPPPIPGQPPEQGPERLRCPNCLNDLAGAMLGGNCPTCGTPIISSHYNDQQSAGYAIASMVLGIVSTSVSVTSLCCCFSTVISFACGVLAIIFYFPARGNIESGNYPPSARGKSIAGLTLGIIGISISILYTLGMGLMMALSP